MADESAVAPAKKTVRLRTKLWKWTKRLVLVVVCGVVALALGGFVYEQTAQVLAAADHPPPGRLLDIGGHSLHIQCSGEGSPTVVFESGLDAMGSLAWLLVQPEVAKFTRVCSYDRAGMMWSEPGPQPRTSRRIAEELHGLLGAADVAGPFVLVGHSLGGPHARVFRQEYPSDVAGMVIVDSSHPGQMSRMPLKMRELAGPPPPAARQFIKAAVACGAQRFMLWVTGFGAPEWATEEELAPYLAFQSRSTGAVVDEMGAIEESMEQVRGTGTLDDLPLIVLTAGAENKGPQPPWMTDELRADIRKVWLELHTELTELSSNGRQIMAKKSGHYIQHDEPELVVDAIREVVEQVRSGTGSR